MKTVSHPRALALALLFVLATAIQAHAAIIPFASRVAFDASFPTASIEDWDGFAAGTTFPDGTTTAGITYTSSAGSALVTGGSVGTTPPNVLGDDAVGFFQPVDTITFGFATPITAFGIDFNTFATTAGSYTATTDGGDVAPSVFDPFPGFSTGQFLGFLSTDPFSSVTIAATVGFGYSLDTMRTDLIPEPASLVLVSLGLVGLGLLRRRSRRS